MEAFEGIHCEQQPWSDPDSRIKVDPDPVPDLKPHPYINAVPNPELNKLDGRRKNFHSQPSLSSIPGEISLFKARKKEREELRRDQPQPATKNGLDTGILDVKIAGLKDEVDRAVRFAKSNLPDDPAAGGIAVAQGLERGVRGFAAQAAREVRGRPGLHQPVLRWGML